MRKLSNQTIESKKPTVLPLPELDSIINSIFKIKTIILKKIINVIIMRFL